METFAPSAESKHLKSPEEELAFLREKLAAKEQEVAALRGEKNPDMIQREAAIATLREHKAMPQHEVLHKDMHFQKKRRTQVSSILLQKSMTIKLQSFSVS